MKYISMYKLDVSLTILMQQIKALLQNIGTTFCPDLLDWFGVDTAGAHSRNADQSVLTKFLQANPSDYSTTKLKVRLISSFPQPDTYCFCPFPIVTSTASIWIYFL